MVYCVMMVIILLLLFINIKSKKCILLETRRQEELVKVVTKKNVELQKCKDEIESYEYFKEALSIFNFDKPIDIVKNRLGHIYLVMENTYGNKLDYLLAGKMHKGIMNCPRVLTEIIEEAEHKYIHIDDIFGVDEDLGNGSILLSYVFKAAERMEISEIRGGLVTGDVQKFDKLEHFYKKNGFDVIFNDARSSGKIVRVINQYSIGGCEKKVN